MTTKKCDLLQLFFVRFFNSLFVFSIVLLTFGVFFLVLLCFLTVLEADFSPRVTHIVTPLVSSSVKCLSACAAGINALLLFVAV